MSRGRIMFIPNLKIKRVLLITVEDILRLRYRRCPMGYLKAVYVV